MLNKELSHFSESKSGNQISEYICNTFLGEYFIYPEDEMTESLNADKDQEVDLEPRGGVEETEVTVGDGEEEGRVMCTIKGVGNKSLNHMNSLPTLNTKVKPHTSF